MPIIRPIGVECPKWEPESPGSKRCRYYIDPAPAELQDEGLCRLPDEFACVEWVRRFGSAEQRAALALRPYPAGSRPVAPADPAAPPPLTLAVQERPPPKLTLVRPPPPPIPNAESLLALGRAFEPAKEVDPIGLAALEQAGAEVELLAPHLERTVTLVPSRTGRTDRFELTFREAAVLRMIVDCFPGSCVVGYRSVPAAASMDPPVGAHPPPPVEAYPPTGTRCSACGEPQFRTPHGECCRNGHGGAEPVQEDPLS
jgi:hypothetical protein